MNAKAKPTGIKRIYLATGHSLRAFKWLIANEAAFKQEFWLSVFLVVGSLFFPFSLFEFVFLWCALLFVLLAEIFNTTIEAVVDRIGAEIHPLSGLAKDLGSLAVMISVIIAILIWASVFVEHYY